MRSQPGPERRECSERVDTGLAAGKDAKARHTGADLGVADLRLDPLQFGVGRRNANTRYGSGW